MALPVLSRVSALARRALPIIERGVREGISATAINNVIRDAFGSGIRRQDLLDVMRGVRGIQASRDTLKSLRSTARPNPSRLPEALTFTRTRYQFTVEVLGRSITTGLPSQRTITVSSDEILTRAEIEDIAFSGMEDEAANYDLEVESTLLVGGRRRPEL